MGILLYAQDAYMLYPLTHENSTLSYLLKDANLSHTFAPNTNLFAALEGGVGLLKSHHNPHIVLLTDDNATLTRSKELAYLQTKGIKLSALSLTKESPSSLQTLCEKTGGVYQPYTWSQEDHHYPHNSRLPLRLSPHRLSVRCHKTYKSTSCTLWHLPCSFLPYSSFR